MIIYIQKNNKKILKKGILITIEGIDGSGKTTHAKMLRDDLQEDGYSVSLLKEPTDGKWGKEIAKLALEGLDTVGAKTVHELFIKDRKENVENKIKPTLEKKDIVIMDRYYFSNIAYQGVELDPEMIERDNNFAPAPDFVIILDLPANIALERVKTRVIKPNLFEQESYLNKVREIFRSRFCNRKNVKIIDSTKSIETNRRVIRELINLIISEDC